jgi:hypothetical protein
MTLLRRGSALVGAMVSLALVGGCDRKTSEPDLGEGSFAQLQRSVLTPTCATSGCHVSASASSAGNLVLTPDAAYRSLAGVEPTNLNAKNDGLRRITLSSPDRSLLYQKIVAAINAHDGAYGGLMPVGRQPLSVGQIEFVRAWIEAGAPETGFVADSMLLRDATAQVTPDFTPLAPPAAGTGYQLKVDPFTVVPDFERELFVLRPLGNADRIYVNRIRTSMRSLSHHFVLYTSSGESPICATTPNVVRDLRSPSGALIPGTLFPMACHIFFGGSMVQQSDYSLPAGVALELPGNASLDVNVHYVNHTATTIPGEAYANLYTVPLTSVQKVAHTLNLSNMSITVPPLKDTTISKTFTFSQTTTVIALTSHMHARGTKFEIRIVGGSRNGESVYVNTDWEHPQLVTFATPILLQPGEGLRSIVTWHNESNRTVTFGLESTDEMAIIFGYYY